MTTTIGEDHHLNKQHSSFEIKILATMWGYEGTLEQYCTQAKKEGYDGIETWWPMEQKDQEELFALLKDHELDVGFLCGGSQTDHKEHLEYFKKMTEAAARNTNPQPLYINCHSGKDYYSYEQNKAFIDFTSRLSKDTGVLICHETHRGRMLYAAPVARQFMEQNPELRITLDASHWCNVSESLLEDQQETMQLALKRAGHIHARIGHPEGPQVNDPRAPEWQAAVNAHLAWWDQVVERKRKEGGRMSFLTEFGPPDYMPTEPYSRKPLSDQWAVNVYMMGVLRERYG